MASHIRHRCGGISVLATIWICPKSRYWQQDEDKPRIYGECVQHINYQSVAQVLKDCL